MKEQAPLGVLPEEKLSHGVLPILVRDSDPQETDEWLSALQYVIENGGPERAAFLLERLKERAFNSGVPFVSSATTPYINTIPTDRQPAFPGDRELERKIKSIIRWNAMAMVVRANRESPGIGGHISTFASAATLYEVAFNHFLRGKDGDGPGDQVFFQGHAAPGIYARAFLEGRLTEEQLANFRRELAPGGGLSSYPHPWLMPDFWEFPTVSMGLGPIMAIYQAWFNHYLVDRGIKLDAADSRVWAFLGDGECDEPETLGAITLAAREKLNNLIFVINCNLQRLDGPVRGNGKVVQELEGAFRGAGWNVIKVIWGSDWDPLLQQDADGLLVRRMGEMVDGQMQKYTVMPGSYIREHFFGADPRLKELVADLTDDQLRQAPPRRPRSGEGVRRLQIGRRAPRLPHRDPGPHHQGLRAGRGGRRPQHHAPAEEAQRRRAAGLPRPLQHSHLRQAAHAAFYKPPEDSPEMIYFHERRKALGGPCPAAARPP